VREGPVRSVVVVLLDEVIEQVLQLADGGGLVVLVAEPLLQRELEALDLAVGECSRSGPAGRLACADDRG
jgi:hypothetical protein